MIETPRLLIRHFEPDDWIPVYSYVSNPEVMRYLPEGVLDQQQTRDFIAEQLEAEPRARALILRESGALIGHMGFHPWFAPQTYELGWVLHPQHHRQGYATEAAHALLRHAFETLRAHRVIATCQPENPASYRVMEKLGMRREGHFRKCIHRGGELWWDELFYAILDEEWQGIKR